MKGRTGDVSYAFKALEEVMETPALAPSKRARKPVGESKSFDLSSPHDVEDAKKAVRKARGRDEEEEKIVDADAETIDKLKPSYLGNAILQCIVCKTLMYKTPDSLKKQDDQEASDTGTKESGEVLYNVGDECPHCGSKDGFLLVGQVASMSAGDEESEDASESSEPLPREEGENDVGASEQGAEDSEGEDDASGGSFRRPSSSRAEESLGAYSSFDDSRFDALVEQFLERTYSNVRSYKTISGSVGMGRLVIEGVITFRSGKMKATKFVFRRNSPSPSGQDRLLGTNETFSRAGNSFGLSGRLDGGTFLCESLSYDYRAGNRRVRGSAKYRIRRH